jgi:hypothetical protein
MLTITITPRAILLAALLIAAGVLAFYATDALGSDPDAYIQGDTNCDGVINADDSLNDLRYTAGLTTGPFPDCPAIGSEAAIPGPPGPQGPQGAPGLSSVTYETASSTVTGTGTIGVGRTATCPAGASALGGGAAYDSPEVSPDFYVSASFPLGEDAWRVQWKTESGTFFAQGTELTTYAICANVAD